MNIYKKMTGIFQNKLLIKYLNNEYCLAIIASLILFLNLVHSSYQTCWKHVFSSQSDISPAMAEYSKSFYSSKFHIWYEGFNFYSLLFFLLVPIVLSCVYSNKYYNKTDINEVYRRGFFNYYVRKFLKALVVSVVISGAAITFFWCCLCIFAHGKGLYIEESGFVPEAYVVPSITILNENIKNLAINSPGKYVFYTFMVFLISGISYCIYVYSFETLIRSKVLRLLMPIVSLIIVDFIIGMFIPNFEGSLMFDIFSPVCLLSLKSIIFFNSGLWLVSVVFLSIHYINRKTNG